MGIENQHLQVKLMACIFVLAAIYMNRSGYIIVVQPGIDIKKYETAHYVQKNLHHLSRLRDILSFIKPTNYRGTGRDFFSSTPYFVHPDNGRIEQWEDIDIKTFDNLIARIEFAKMEFNKTAQKREDDTILFTLDEMLVIYELIENKADYEIIEFIEKESATNPSTLGYDVGYLASDYSVIADTAIKPTWHPPNFDDMQDIIKHLRQLNEYCLFPTLDQANNYRQLYLSKKWGEKELYEGQITTIQIRTL